MTIKVLDGTELRLGPNSILHGWSNLLDRWGNPAKLIWDKYMHTELFGIFLCSAYESPTLQDVVAFCLFVMSGQVLRADWPASRRRRDEIITVFIQMTRLLIVPLFNFYLHDVLPSVHDVSAPPYALRFGRVGARPRACKLDADQALAILQRAQTSHVSNVRTILECKRDEKEFDSINLSIAGSWQRQELNIYFDIHRADFRGRRQVCVMADPSSHGGEERMVSILWSWETGRAAIGAVKRLPPFYMFKSR